MYIDKFIQSEISKIEREYEIKTKYCEKPLHSQDDLVCLILDPGNFKSVNNSFGYKIGNRVLKEMAELLEKESRKSDILVRWSSDEFLIAICYTDRNIAYQQAERLLKAIEHHQFDLGQGEKYKLTCSIGFAPYPFLPQKPKLVNWERTLHISVIALNAAKNSGGNAWVGMMSTENTKIEKIFDRVLHNTNELITNGELEIFASIKNKNAFVWQK